MTPFAEEEILDEGARKKIIDQIEGPENLERKNEAIRRHEIYRDKNLKWVMAALANEGYKKTTLAQMQNRAANISICRKIVNKLAITYNGGVDRKAKTEADQKNLDAMVKTSGTDGALKKSDRYRQLFHNCLLGVLPVATSETREGDEEPLYMVTPRLLAPWEYDVIEKSEDPTQAAVVIVSDFPQRMRVVTANSEAYQRGAEGYRAPSAVVSAGDGIDQTIADTPADKGSEEDKRHFIWWSENYHFTTDAKGKIIPEKGNEENENPIGMLPWVPVTTDQDGSFWAQGGEDIVDGSISANKKLTDINYIAFVQGWGQLFVAAKEIPKNLQGGPDNAFLFEMNAGDPPPIVAFASSNPPLEAWLKTLEAELAMLLTTNDLSVKSVSAQLTVDNAASGVAMMIDTSELNANVQDVQQRYQVIEPIYFTIFSKWIETLAEKQSLCKAQAEIKPLKEPAAITTKFHEVKPPITESAKLDDLTKRKGLGIDTLLDLIKKDNPDLTDEEAQKKLAELTAEKQANAKAFGTPPAEGDSAAADGNGDADENGKAADGKPPFGKPTAGVRQRRQV